MTLIDRIVRISVRIRDITLIDFNSPSKTYRQEKEMLDFLFVGADLFNAMSSMYNNDRTIREGVGEDFEMVKKLQRINNGLIEHVKSR